MRDPMHLAGHDPHDPAPLRPGAHYDVIVVGARVAGAATALLLAQRGLRTLLLEHRPFGTDTLSTHALMRGGVLQLSRWGVLDDIVAAGTPPVRRTTFTYAAHQVCITLKSSHGVDALYAPRRTVLDPALLTAAVDAGVEAHDRTTVTGLLRQGGRVTGVRATTSAGPVDLRADLVVGADGLDSMVAGWAGAEVTRRGRHATAVTYAYWPHHVDDGYHWIYRRDAAAGLIPTNDGLACVFASASPARIGRGGAEVVRAVVAAGAPDVASTVLAGPPQGGARTWRGRPGFMRRACGPGWALVGDAGHFKDPLSAHGITDALRDAELLARAVADGAGSAGDLDHALRDYGSTRDRLSVELFDIVDRIASHEWDDAEVADLLLQLNSAMATEVEFLADLGASPVR